MIRRFLARFIPARFRPAPVVPVVSIAQSWYIKATLEQLCEQLGIARDISRAYEAEQAERLEQARLTYRLVYGAPLMFPNLAARITMGDTIKVRRPARFRMPVPGDFRPAQESAN